MCWTTLAKQFKLDQMLDYNELCVVTVYNVESREFFMDLQC